MTSRKTGIVLFAVMCITLILGGSILYSANVTSLSGYQSITAEWNKIVWTYEDGSPYEKSVSGNIVTWDASDAQPYGFNKNSYTGEVEQPKFDRNINYNDWWLNDTVSEENPEGLAKHFEWSIDIYTINVNFRVTEGICGADDAEWWLELKNNVNSVFALTGAEEAVSYVIYAQTEEYTKVPENAANAIILPTVSNFEMTFLDGTKAVPPSVPQKGSDLDFDKLEPYSHVAIKFIFDDFGAAWLATQPVVNMIVELNVLTIGRFDYALTYVAAGEDKVAPIGNLGLFDSIGAALGAGFSALMDGIGGIASDLFAPLIIIAVIVISIVILFAVIRFKK